MRFSELTWGRRYSPNKSSAGMAFLAFLWNFFLYLATLAWAIRNETESEHFTSAHVFRARVKLHLGPESPDVGSFIPYGQKGRTGKTGFRGKCQSWVTPLAPDCHDAAVLGQGCPHSCGRDVQAPGGPGTSLTGDWSQAQGQAPQVCWRRARHSLRRAWQSLS